MTTTAATQPDVRAVLYAEAAKVAAEQGKGALVPADDMPLLDSKLDSLAFAILVARMEEVTGVDPFAEGDGDFPATFGDLARAYSRALGQSA
ncbi:MAG: hypothetical protein KGI57_02655, partial [Hyphomicrobiales bacterium]|nr:hypothetical protein [Hyphomicrobiales bacterium]